MLPKARTAAGAGHSMGASECIPFVCQSQLKRLTKYKPASPGEITRRVPTPIFCSLGKKVSGIFGWSFNELVDWAIARLCF